MSGAFAQTELAGQVLAISGDVKAIDSAGKERALVRGAPIRQGDRVVTADGALAQIKMADGGMISVRPGTEVSFDRYVHDEANQKNSGAVISLVRGGLRSITGMIGKTNPDAYQIKTPSATIGIRGTDHEPVYVPPPMPGMAAPAVLPGVYDKVNQGETLIRNELGTIALKVGQVGFAPLQGVLPPKLLEKIPDFYRLELKFDPVATTKREVKDEGKVDTARQRLLPASTTVLRAGTELGTKTIDSGAVSTSAISSGALSTSTLSTSTVSTTTVSPTLSPTVSPTLTTTISPTLTTTISPTLTTTTVAPTTTSTTTLSPTTTINSSILTSPTLLNSTTTLK